MCAQIGKNVHISGGAGIGGVLEPLQAGPVIVEDNCFIGARSEVVEGVVVREGAVLSMGVFIGASTKIVDRVTGEVHIGEVPAYSVVVPGSLPGKPLADGSPGPLALLRRHHQDGGRGHSVEDLDQRTPAGLRRAAVYGFSWIMTVVIGGVAGWIASRIMDERQGILMNILVGVLGAVLFNGILRLFLMRTWGGLVGQLAVAVCGACILIFVFRKLRARR